MNKIKKFIGWFHNNETPIIRTVYVIPILFAAFVSINHVIEFYSLTNPHTWAIYLSVGIEIAALSALAGMVRHVNKNVYIPFILVTFIQIVGNIFYSYQFIDVNGKLFKTWVEVMGIMFSFENQIITNKLIISIISGGLLPVISLSFLHLLVSFNTKTESEKLASKEESILNNDEINDDLGHKHGHSVQVDIKEDEKESIEPDGNVVTNPIINNEIIESKNDSPTINEAKEIINVPEHDIQVDDKNNHNSVDEIESNTDTEEESEISEQIEPEIIPIKENEITHEDIPIEEKSEPLVSQKIVKENEDSINIEEDQNISDLKDESLDLDESEEFQYRHTAKNDKLGQATIQRVFEEEDTSQKYQRKRVTPNKTRF